MWRCSTTIATVGRICISRKARPTLRDFIGEAPNLLFRSVAMRLRDETKQALREVNRYTIGCTAGDWNQDGFEDLVVANIGFNSSVDQ